MNPSPSKLVNWCRSKAVNAPGHTRAILLLISSPLAIDIHRRTNATIALARDRYQKTCGSVAAIDPPSTGTHTGMVTRASAVPATMAIIHAHRGTPPAGRAAAWAAAVGRCCFTGSCGSGDGATMTRKGLVGCSASLLHICLV